MWAPILFKTTLPEYPAESGPSCSTGWIPGFKQAQSWPVFPIKLYSSKLNPRVRQGMPLLAQREHVRFFVPPFHWLFFCVRVFSLFLSGMWPMRGVGSEHLLQVFSFLRQCFLGTFPRSMGRKGRQRTHRLVYKTRIFMTRTLFFIRKFTF